MTFSNMGNWMPWFLFGAILLYVVVGQVWGWLDRRGPLGRLRRKGRP